jgi:hypothetical protein
MSRKSLASRSQTPKPAAVVPEDLAPRMAALEL